MDGRSTVAIVSVAAGILYVSDVRTDGVGWLFAVCCVACGDGGAGDGGRADAGSQSNHIAPAPLSVSSSVVCSFARLGPVVAGRQKRGGRTVELKGDVGGNVWRL